MARQRRTRRILKWAGLVLSVFIVVLWVMSVYLYGLQYAVVDRHGPQYDGQHLAPVVVFFTDGAIWFSQHSDDSQWAYPAWNAFRKDQMRKTQPVWWPSYNSRVPADPAALNRMLVLPLWIPFLLIAIPTAYLWRRYRRITPGHCPKCGYNLTGNLSGVCPECGVKVDAASAPKG